MNLFADRILDRTVFGYEVSAGQFLSFNALFIILLASFRLIWPNLGKYNPNTAVKFALALALVGLGFER
jgi:POT family proton-dependent oligopeptide transporter